MAINQLVIAAALLLKHLSEYVKTKPHMHKACKQGELFSSGQIQKSQKRDYFIGQLDQGSLNFISLYIPPVDTHTYSHLHILISLEFRVQSCMQCRAPIAV